MLGYPLQFEASLICLDRDVVRRSWEHREISEIRHSYSLPTNTGKIAFIIKIWISCLVPTGRNSLARGFTEKGFERVKNERSDREI